MKLKIRVKTCGTRQPTCFTEKQLEEIASWLEVVDPRSEETRLVHFGKFAPHDVSLPWQKINDAGTPIGEIKYYKNGAWQ